MPDLKGDAARLMQAVLNVARNAAQELVARPAGPQTEPGVVTLRTRVARQVMLAHRQHRLALELSIIDNGPGVPDHIRDRIFHPLVTARAGGLFRAPSQASRVPSTRVTLVLSTPFIPSRINQFGMESPSSTTRWVPGWVGTGVGSQAVRATAASASAPAAARRKVRFRPRIGPECGRRGRCGASATLGEGYCDVGHTP